MAPELECLVVPSVPSVMIRIPSKAIAVSFRYLLAYIAGGEGDVVQIVVLVLRWINAQEYACMADAVDDFSLLARQGRKGRRLAKARNAGGAVVIGEVADDVRNTRFRNLSVHIKATVVLWLESLVEGCRGGRVIGFRVLDGCGGSQGGSTEQNSGNELHFEI